MVKEPCLEDGIWEEKGLGDYFVSAARVKNDNPNDASIKQRWLEEACAVESIIYSCYYWQKNDSQSIDYRRWKPTDPNSKCQPYWPFDFLTKMKDKNIVFTGDSVMGEIYFAFICTLSKITKLDYDVDSYPTRPTNYCPFGTFHCAYTDSTIRVPAVNATLKFARMQLSRRGKPTIDGKYFGAETIWRPVYQFPVTTTAYIFNFGLHINDAAEYSNMMQWFLNDFSFFNHSHGHATGTFPRLYFLETTPQHFGGSNGYYTSEIADNLNKEYKSCVPLNYTDDQQEFVDWRNRLLSEHVNATIQEKYNVRIIKIARGLYSQYDAHVGPTMNWDVRTVDCTHYCFPAGVFDYIIRKIYNSLLYNNFF